MLREGVLGLDFSSIEVVNKAESYFIFGTFHISKSKCTSKKLGRMPCLRMILNCFALEHSVFRIKHLKVS